VRWPDEKETFFLVRRPDGYSAVKFNLVHGSALTGKQVERWDALINSDARFDSPYFRPEFTQSVSEVRDDVEVAFVEDGRETIAIFPFQRGPFGLGLPVGGMVSDFHGLICATGVDIEPRELLGKCGLWAWQFDHLLPTSNMFTPFHNQLRDSFYLDLRQGFHAYLNDLRKRSKTRVTNIERKKRKIERDIGPLRFELHTDQSSAFEQLLRWKSRQYGDTGVVDVFEYDWVTSLLQKIISHRGNKFSGLFSTLHAGERLVAVHAGMRSHGVAHYWFPSFDRDIASYSPGIILLLHLARALGERGVRRLDLGAGNERYKTLFANGSLLLASGTVDKYAMAKFIRSNLSRCHHIIRSAGLGKMLPGFARFIYNHRQHILFR
jgi:CelD/BcsL family acetyltransferase involved in cellulose biosynthesis